MTESTTATSEPTTTSNVSAFDAAVAALEAGTANDAAADTPNVDVDVEGEFMADDAAPTGADDADANVDNAPGEPTPAAKPKHDRGKVFRALDKKKAAIKAQQAELDNQRAALGRQAEELNASSNDAANFRRLRQLASDNPLAVLGELGLSLEALAKQALEADTPDARVSAALKQVETERQRLLELESRFRERETARFKNQVEQDFLVVASDRAAYPELAIYAPAEIIEAGHHIANQLASRGVEMKPGPKMFALVAKELNNALAVRHADIRNQGAPAAAKKTAGDNGTPPAKKPLPRQRPKPETKTRDELLRDEAIAALNGRSLLCPPVLYHQQALRMLSKFGIRKMKFTFSFAKICLCSAC